MEFEEDHVPKLSAICMLRFVCLNCLATYTKIYEYRKVLKLSITEMEYPKHNQTLSLYLEHA